MYALINNIFRFITKWITVIFKILKGRRSVQFRIIRGNKTLRLNYDLNENSVVFDVGGYQGNWAEDIFKLYHSKLYIFEPVSEYAEKIKKRFIRNSNIKIFNIGLASTNAERKIAVIEKSSSFFRQSRQMENVKLLNIIDFMKNKNIENIDLMKINIEGGEYELLECLISSNFVTKIKNIQIQFHDFMPNAKKRMNRIQENLKRTHFLTYQFEFIWENWKKKNN